MPFKKTKIHPKLDFNYVTDGISIGTNQCCQSHFDERLKRKGITADISLERDRLDAPFGVDFYVWIPVTNHKAPAADQLEFGVSVLQKMVAMGKQVYVHCQNGHGRAPTLVAAYLMRHRRMTPRAAVSLIQSKRPRAHLQEVQVRALERFGRKK